MTARDDWPTIAYWAGEPDDPPTAGDSSLRQECFRVLLKLDLMAKTLHVMAGRLDELEPVAPGRPGRRPPDGFSVFNTDTREIWVARRGEWVVEAGALPPGISMSQEHIEHEFGVRPVFVPGNWSVEWSGSSRAYEAAFPLVHKQIAAEVADLIESNRIPPDPNGSQRKDGNADQITETACIEAHGAEDVAEGHPDAE